MDAVGIIEDAAIVGGIALLVTSALSRSAAMREVDRRMHRLLSLQGAVVGSVQAARGPVSILEAAGRLLVPHRAAQAELSQQLRQAGLPGDAALAFAGGRLLLALFVGAAVWWLQPLAGADEDGKRLAHAAAASILVAVLAARMLASRARSRSIRLRAEMPASIDTLTVALEGGAGIEQALRFSADQQAHPSPLFQRALRTAVADLERGTPHDEVLVRLGERLASEEATALVEVLRQSLRHGTEIVPPLRALGNDLSDARLADARAAVGRATAAMTVVMVACFLPILLTLILAPSLSGIMGMLDGMN